MIIGISATTTTGSVAATIGVVTTTIGVVTVTTTGADKPAKTDLATTNEHPLSGVFGFVASAPQGARPGAPTQCERGARSAG